MRWYSGRRGTDRAARRRSPANPTVSSVHRASSSSRRLTPVRLQVSASEPTTSSIATASSQRFTRRSTCSSSTDFDRASTSTGNARSAPTRVGGRLMDLRRAVTATDRHACQVLRTDQVNTTANNYSWTMSLRDTLKSTNAGLSLVAHDEASTTHKVFRLRSLCGARRRMQPDG